MNALLYLLARSFKNAALKRLRRLRQPRYLISTLVGVGYLYFVLGGGISRPASSGPSMARPLLETIVLAIVALSVTWTWLFPDKTALVFSPAEIQFLFPAPLERTWLIRLKVASAQIGTVFTGLFAVYATRRSETLHGWFVFVGTWLTFNAAFLHRLAAALSLVPTGSPARFRWPVVLGRLAVAGLWGSVLVSLVQSGVFTGGREIHEMGAALEAPPALYALAPLRALVAPALATDRASFLAALPWSVAVVAALYLWVVLADRAFEEAAIASSEAFARKLETFRRTGRLAPADGKVGPAPVTLAWSGRPLPALVWKNFLLYTRTPLSRVVAFGGLCLAGAGVIARTPSLEVLCKVGVPASFGIASMLTFIGPEMLRNDLRTSLASAELLKAIPLPGWALFLGEVLAPVLILGAFQAFLLGVGAVLLGGIPDGHVDATTRALGWLAAAITILPFDLLLFALSNGAALVFPAWVPLGPERRRAGPEAGGMRLLVALARLVLLATGFLPAAIVGFLAASVGWTVLGLGPFALPLAAVLAALVVLGEAGALIYLLGGVLERFDPAAELR